MAVKDKTVAEKPTKVEKPAEEPAEGKTALFDLI